jgi:predicted DNA-binding protein
MNANSTSVYLPPPLREKIDEAARSDGRTRSGFIRHALERAVHEVTGASRLADLEHIAAAGLSKQETEMADDRTALDKDLPRHSSVPARDIYSPQRPRNPSTPTGYASEPLPNSKDGVVPRSRFSSNGK